jgi:hypothetical protein
MSARIKNCLVALWLLVFVTALQADTVQLVNGDAVSGKVISLDAKQLKLESDALGQLTIDRSKIATIHLGDAPPPKPAPAAAALPKPPVPIDLLDQLRGGIDPEAIKEIKKNFPLLATPAAGKYFDTTLSGLMNGTLNVQDIRKDAQKALDEVKKIEKELGPQATQGLQPYVGILENFLRNSEPAKQAPPSPPTKK